MLNRGAACESKHACDETSAGRCRGQSLRYPPMESKGRPRIRGYPSRHLLVRTPGHATLNGTKNHGRTETFRTACHQTACSRDQSVANLSEPAAVVRALNEGSTDSRPIISVRGRNRCGTESGLPFSTPVTAVSDADPPRMSTNGLPFTTDAHRNGELVNRSTRRLYARACSVKRGECPSCQQNGEMADLNAACKSCRVNNFSQCRDTSSPCAQMDRPP